MKSTLFLILFIASFNVMAVQNGNDKGNGGDSCEARIYQIRNDIINWIDNGGPENLKLPTTTTLNNYSSSMKKQMQEAIVECVSDKLTVFGAEKTCINIHLTKDSSKIICNLERFLKLPESQQYELTHHEYAGLSGLETNVGAESNYEISQQITSFLKVSTERKLAIKKQYSDTSLICSNGRDTFETKLNRENFEFSIRNLRSTLNLSKMMNLPKEDSYNALSFKVPANKCSWEPATARLTCNANDVLIYFKNNEGLIQTLAFERLNISSGVLGVGINSLQIVSINFMNTDKNTGILTKSFKDTFEFRAYNSRPLGATFDRKTQTQPGWLLCQRSVN